MSVSQSVNCRILRTVFTLNREIAAVGTHCAVVTVFAVHLGYSLSLEKENNCTEKSMEKVLNFAYKNEYKP